MNFFTPGSKLFSNIIQNRALSLLTNSTSEEYFIVLTSLLDTLRFENYKGFNDFDNKKLVKFNDPNELEKNLFSEIFNNMWGHNDSRVIEINKNLKAIEHKVNNNKYRIVPYLVDQNSKSDHSNIGNQGFAGKMRDDDQLRQENTFVIIFDVNPIETLITASDMNLLDEEFSKKSLKSLLKSGNSVPEWYKDLVDSCFLSNIVHSMNVIERINFLYAIKMDGFKRGVNEYIKKYRLPLFYFEDPDLKIEIKSNYKKFVKINNNHLEPFTSNFYKDTLDEINYVYLPDNLNEDKFNEIFKNDSLHISELYNHIDLTYGRINSLFNTKGASKIKGLKVDPDNYLYQEIKSTKTKEEGVISKGNLSSVNFSLNGIINPNDKYFLHYYFDVDKKSFKTVSFNNQGVCDVSITKNEKEKYRNLNIIVNQSKDDIKKSVIEGRFIIQEKSDAIVVPQGVNNNLKWYKNELYPRLIMNDIDNKKSINCLIKKENGNTEIKNLPLKTDEGNKKYIVYNDTRITKVIIEENQEENPTVNHLLHFITDKGINSFDDINLRSEEYTSFSYKNVEYSYEVDEEFEKMLNKYGFENLNQLYLLILNNPDDYYYYNYEGDNYGFKNDFLSSEADDVINKRKEVLNLYKKLYLDNDKELKDKFIEFNKKAREYLVLFNKKVEEIPKLVKLDILEFDDNKLLSPFAPVNLAFYLKFFDDIVFNENKDLADIADNSEIFKYIYGEGNNWYKSQSSPAFLWSYYVAEKNPQKYGKEKYLDNIVRDKIKHLKKIYSFLFNKNNTIQIGVLNPDNAKFIVDGVKKFIDIVNKSNEDVNNLPNIHISLINNENTYTKLDEEFEKNDRNEVEEIFINKISYSNVQEKLLKDNENIFYHLLFVKDLFKIDQTPGEFPRNKDFNYINTYFGYGLTSHPITASKYETNLVAYKSFTNYKNSSENNDILKKLLSKTNNLYTQAFQTDLNPETYRLRKVKVETSNMPRDLFEISFMVTFLDREIDIDIFNTDQIETSEKPFLVDYSNYSSITAGSSDEVKFLTITNQKKPFIEIFKAALNDFGINNIEENILLNRFEDLNLLNGFWVLDLLGSENNPNKVKGILGTLVAFKHLVNNLYFDENYWHIPIGIEEFMGVVPGYSNKIKMRFDDSDLDNKYCDDLAVISFPKNRENINQVNIKLVEVKNSKNKVYVAKGIEQLIETNKRLERYFNSKNETKNKYQLKDIVNWLLYSKNKYLVFDKEYLRLNNGKQNAFIKDLYYLIDKLNHGEVSVNVDDGLLISVNSTLEIEEHLELNEQNFISISDDIFNKTIKGEMDNRTKIYDNKIFDIFDIKETSESGHTESKEQNERGDIVKGEKDGNNKEVEKKDEDEIIRIEREPKINIVPIEDESNRTYKALAGRKMTASADLVYYDPLRRGNRLPNMNLMITGSPGKGKTQLLKSLILQQKYQGVNFFIFDFKNDFSDKRFLELADIEYINLEMQGLPYNPLIPPIKKDPNIGMEMINANEQAMSISGVLKSVYGLGNIQEAKLKNTLRTLYKQNNINPRKTIEYSDDFEFPVLDQVEEILREEAENAAARLDPIFSYGLFNEEYKDIPLSKLFNKSYVFNISTIPNDEIKNAISKMVVVSAHQYLNTLEHSSKLKNVFVFDEAHRFLDEPKLKSLVRECRAYGLGVWLSSQFPKDYDNDYAGAMETKIVHGNGEMQDQIRSIKKLTGFEGADGIIKDLGLFEAIFVNSHFSNSLIKTLTYPHVLILIAAKRYGSLTLNLDIEGVKQDMQFELIKHLEEMGLLKSEDDKFVLTDTGESALSNFTSFS